MKPSCKLEEIEFVPHPNNCKFLDFTGQRFGKRLVLGYVGKSRWAVLCDCGDLSYITRPQTGVSCGCHWELKRGLKLSRTPEYSVYRTTCRNHADEFDFTDFRHFYETLGPRPTDGKWWLERIDKEQNYKPGNVRWAECAGVIRRRKTK